jgi:hypothetical protein
VPCRGRFPLGFFPAMGTSVIALPKPLCVLQRLTETGARSRRASRRLCGVKSAKSSSIRVAASTQALDFSRQPWTFEHISRVLAMAQSSKERWLSRPETLMPRIQIVWSVSDRAPYQGAQRRPALSSLVVIFIPDKDLASGLEKTPRKNSSA